MSGDISSGYDDYYREGIYDAKLHGEINVRIMELLIERSVAAIKKKGSGVITYLDFGAGNGRFHKFAERLAKAGIKVNVIALDPSTAGLQAYEASLLEKGYARAGGDDLRRIDYEIGKEGERGYSGSEYSSRNGLISVRFVNTALDDSPEHIKRLIGDVELAISPYAPIASIPGRENRRAALRIMAEVTSGDVVVSVPNIAGYRGDVRKYKVLIEAGTPFERATEPGDIYYRRTVVLGGGEKEIENFVHVYTPDELLDDFISVGMDPRDGVRAEKTRTEADLAQASRREKIMDADLAESLGEKEIEERALYILAVASGLRAVSMPGHVRQPDSGQRGR